MTISSLGGIGGSAFTPIVNPPEVAILGITRAKMEPVWDGKEFQPRLMCLDSWLTTSKKSATFDG